VLDLNCDQGGAATRTRSTSGEAPAPVSGSTDVPRGANHHQAATAAAMSTLEGCGSVLHDRGKMVGRAAKPLT